MPSDAPTKPEPADIDRLTARLALVQLGELESIILIEVLAQSIEGTDSLCWKEIAQRYGFQATHVSRAKSALMLSNRLIEHDGSFYVDLDPAVWFPKSERGQAKRLAAKRLHDIKVKHLPKLVSADASQLPSVVTQPIDLPRMVTSELPKLVTSTPDLPRMVTRSPNRNASAPARGIELNLIERINQFNSGSESNSAHEGEPLASHDPSELAKVVALAAREFDQAFADQAELFADQFENLPLLMEAISAMAEESRRAEKEIAHPWPWTDGAGESRDGYVMTVYRNMLAGNRPVRAARRKTEWDEMPAVPPPYVDETPEESRRAFDRQMAAIKKAWAEQDAQKNAPPTPKVRTWPDLIKIAPGFAEFANQ